MTTLTCKISAEEPAFELLSERLSKGEQSRLSRGLAALVDRLTGLIKDLELTPAEMRRILMYLTEVGHSADPRRQEWVLLADALGLNAAISALNTARPKGCTPETPAGPFYRPDAPERENGACLSLDGQGTPLFVKGRVLAVDGKRIANALVEVWQANAQGLYENQEPDLQPEHNLRAKLRTDEAGGFHFTSVMPKGYALPQEGPVADLLHQLGLSMERPAHLHFRVSAAGYQRLTTQIFDRDDPAIERDAVFAARPQLWAEFAPVMLEGGITARELQIDLVLCPDLLAADHLSH